jgi:hypothetical protein
MKLTGETYPSATLSTTNPKWIDHGSNPGVRGERPATNRLSHGTALVEFGFSQVTYLLPKVLTA